MIPEIRLVERCGDAMANLKPTSGRSSLHAQPINRVAAHLARPATEWEWALLLLERKHALHRFSIEDLEVEIGEEAQARLKGSILDLADGKIITIPST